MSLNYMSDMMNDNKYQYATNKIVLNDPFIDLKRLSREILQKCNTFNFNMARVYRYNSFEKEELVHIEDVKVNDLLKEVV